MPFAIELYFDHATESKIRSVWSELAAAALPAWPLRTGSRPHVSILIVDSATSDEIDIVFRSIGVFTPFQLFFHSTGALGDEESVIFLRPDDSAQLRSSPARGDGSAIEKVDNSP